MRRVFIAGNWKMNTSLEESQTLIAGLCQQLEKAQGVDIAVCPPFTHLSYINNLLKQHEASHIQMGAQNMHWETSGAFTGEISASMLKNVGCAYVILGHSERRTLFAETDEMVNKKLKSALKNGLLPIVCIGETLEERESNVTFEVIERQLSGGLQELAPAQIEACTIAYEPVWAIGTGKTASPEMAQEVHHFIRKHLSRYGESVAQSVRIQYGGSVKPNNIEALIQQPDIDGALVGGASLEIESFSQIIHLSKKGI